jgi:hypothetical protein
MFPREQPLLADLPSQRVTLVGQDENIASAVERTLGRRRSLELSAQATPESDPGEDELLGLCAELTQRGRQRFVHLVNYRQAEPVRNVSVRLRIPRGSRVKELVLASPERQRDLPLPYEQEGGFVTFVAPQVSVYEVAVVSMSPTEAP